MSYPHWTPDSQRSPLDQQSANNLFPSGAPPSFKTNVNRMKTKRWVEAKAPSYDDWDDYDDGYYDPPPPQPQYRDATRSFTDPQAMAGPSSAHGRKHSFDAGDDRRAFSQAHKPQPTLDTRVAPSGFAPQSSLSPDVMSPPVSSGIQNQQPLYQQHQDVPTHANRQSNSASWNQAGANEPQSAHMEPQQRRASSPIAPPQPLQTRASPPPSDTVGGRFPPRKSSLSRASPVNPPQQFPPPAARSETPTSPSSQRTSSLTNKALPIIRPSDIYKRMEEERERERRSMDSSRPSIDSITSRPGDDTAPNKRPTEKPSLETPSRSTGQRSSVERAQDDSDSGRHLRSTLETVAERKSEYLPGFTLPKQEPLAQGAAASPTQANQEPGLHVVNVAPQVTPSQSQTTNSGGDRPYDTTSLSTTNYLQGGAEQRSLDDKGNGALSLPEVNRLSTFGDDFWSNTPIGHDAQMTSQLSIKETNAPTKDHPEQSAAPGEEAASPAMLGNTYQIPRKPSPTPSHSRTPSVAIAQTPVAVQQDSSSNEPFEPPSLDPAEQPSKPTQAHADPSILPSLTPLPKSESISNPPQDYTAREADLATAAHSDSPGELETLANKQKEVQSTFLDNRKVFSASDFETASKPSSPRSRSSSPTKSRVRDLAGKFDEIAESRRSSVVSTSSKKDYASPTKSKEDVVLPESGGTPTAIPPPEPAAPHSPGQVIDNGRPAPTRDPSFRPKLPGQWDSFTTTTGAATPTETPAEPQESTPQTEAHSPIQEGPKEEIDFTPTSQQTTSAPGMANIPFNPMAALASAGNAMGEAIKESVGLEQEKESGAINTSSVDPTSHSRAVGDIYTRPLAPERAESSMTASTVGPTPPPKEDPFQHASEDRSVGVAPAVPLKDRPVTPPAENVSTEPTDDSSTPQRPSIEPQLSIDAAADDEESDRLRKEIVASLSPGASSTQLAPPTVDSDDFRGHRDSSILPAEYDSYWAGADDRDLIPNRLSIATSSPEASKRSVDQTPVSDSENISSSANKEEPLEQATASSREEGPDVLGKRFSWEQTQAAQTTLQPPAANPTPPTKSEELTPDPLSVSSEVSPLSTKEEKGDPAPTTGAGGVSPVTVPPLNVGQDQPVSPVEPHQTLPEPIRTSVDNKQPAATDTGNNAQSPSSQPRFPFFREILAMKSPSDRIATYNKTREQFAATESGLRNWLSTTLVANSDHEELRNGAPVSPLPPPGSGSVRHRHTPSLSLFGKASTPYYQQYIESASQMPAGSQPGPASNSPTSGHPQIEKTPTTPSSSARITSHQMQAKGKDLLHTAGVLGGKYTTSAKGLFAKGKSKFRSSGSEKVPQTSSSRKSSTERPSFEWREGEKRRSVSISPFRRPGSRSRPASIAVQNTGDHASVHSQDTHLGSVKNKRHSYAGESWMDSSTPTLNATPERLGVLPSPAASAFIANQSDSQARSERPPLPENAKERILQSVIRHSTPPVAEHALEDFDGSGRTTDPDMVTQSNHDQARGHHIPVVVSQNSTDVSPVEQADHEHLLNPRLAVDTQPSTRAISPLLPDQSQDNGDVSPISVVPASNSYRSHHVDGSDPANVEASDATSGAIARHLSKAGHVEGSPKAFEKRASKEVERTEVRSSTYTYDADSSSLTVEEATPQLNKRESRSMVFHEQGSRASTPDSWEKISHADGEVREDARVHQLEELPMQAPDPVPNAFSYDETRRPGLLQSLSNAVSVSSGPTQYPLSSGEFFAVRVVGSPQLDRYEEPTVQTPRPVAARSERPVTPVEVVEEVVSPMSDDELYADHGGAIPEPSNKIHEELTNARLAPPQSHKQKALDESELADVNETSPPRLPFADKTNRYSASSQESRPMSFVTLPRDEAGRPQEFISRAPLVPRDPEREPQEQHQPAIYQPPPFHNQSVQQPRMDHQAPLSQQSEDVAIHRYQPPQHSKPGQGRRVSGSAPLPNLTAQPHRPIEPDIAYNSIHPRDQYAHHGQQAAVQNPLMDPRQHSAESQPPSAGAPALATQEAKAKRTSLLRNRHSPSPVSAATPDSHADHPPQSGVGSMLLESSKGKDKKKSKASSFFKGNKRSDSIGHDSQVSNISGLTKESTKANAADSRWDLGVPKLQSASQGLASNAPNNDQKDKYLQRASTSGVPETHKKKRFSGLGSLFKRSESTGHTPRLKFGRSDHKSRMPTVPDSPPPQHAPLASPTARPGMPPPNLSTESAYSATHDFIQQRSSYNETENADEEGQPPPPGGYYAPGPQLQPPVGALGAAGSFDRTRRQASSGGRSNNSSHEPSTSAPLQQPSHIQSPRNDPLYETPDIPAAYDMSRNANGAVQPPQRYPDNPDQPWPQGWQRGSQDHGAVSPPSQRHPSVESYGSAISPQISGQSRPYEPAGSPPVLSPVSSNSSSQVASPPRQQHPRVQAPRMNSISETAAQHQERPWNISIPLEEDDSDHSRRDHRSLRGPSRQQSRNQLEEAPHRSPQPSPQPSHTPTRPQLQLQTNSALYHRPNPPLATVGPIQPPSSTTPSSPMQRYREILPRGTPQPMPPPSFSQPQPLHPVHANNLNLPRAGSRGHSPLSASPANYPLPTSPGVSSPVNPLASGFPLPPPPGQHHTSKSLEPREGVQELPADEDDEPVMRATSYPGMEWAPRWDEY